MAKSKSKSRVTQFDPPFKLKVVQASLKKKLTAAEIRKVYGVGPSTWYRWKKLYKEGGKAALIADGSTQRRKKPKVEGPAEEKLRKAVLDTKAKFPFFGIGRIWHWLRRTLLLPVTRPFIRRTLKEEGLLEKPKRKRKKSKPKPKRFERGRPNQLWQSDITAFTIKENLRVYLIAFMDDHSRYIVGWGLFAGHTGRMVLEVLRNAFATYGRPPELLTDNGPQYKTWRGVTAFQKELQREGVLHITSRPHHPQTLGKIEAFWGHMKREFLRHVVMGGLEDMRERLGHWIKHYNFQRPHEGIGNATPAERFFDYAKMAREEIEKGVKANEESLALALPTTRGAIGESRIGGKEVQVRKENGKFLVSVGGTVVNRTELKPETEEQDEAKEATFGSDGGRGSAGEGPSGDGALGALRREDDLGGLPGDGAETDPVLQTGGPDGLGDGGDGENASGEGTEEEPARGGVEPLGEDGGASPGAPEDAEPGAGLEEAPSVRSTETAQEGPGEADKGGFGGEASEDHGTPTQEPEAGPEPVTDDVGAKQEVE